MLRFGGQSEPPHAFVGLCVAEERNEAAKAFDGVGVGLGWHGEGRE